MIALDTITDATRKRLPDLDAIRKQAAMAGKDLAATSRKQARRAERATTEAIQAVAARRSPNRWRGFLMGQLGGAVGLLAMDAYWRWVESRMGAGARGTTGDRPVPRQLDESQAAAGRFLYAQLAGREPQSPELHRTLGQLARWGFGVALGGIYGALRTETGLLDLRGGLLWGGGVYPLASGSIGPLLGLDTDPLALPAKDHALRLGGQLVYGLATAATTQLLARPIRTAMLVALGAAGVAYIQSSRRDPAIDAFVGSASAKVASLTGNTGGPREQGESPVASVPHREGIKATHTIVVNRPPADLYRYWRDFANLPRFMQHLERVQALTDGRSRWRAKAPLGTTVEWEARVINEVENELIAWQSLPGSTIGNAGSVRFVPVPGGGGTEVRVALSYDPPAGPLGAVVARLLGEEPHAQVADDLGRFKEMLEAGPPPVGEPQPQASLGA